MATKKKAKPNHHSKWPTTEAKSIASKPAKKSKWIEPTYSAGEQQGKSPAPINTLPYLSAQELTEAYRNGLVTKLEWRERLGFPADEARVEVPVDIQTTADGGMQNLYADGRILFVPKEPMIVKSFGDLVPLSLTTPIQNTPEYIELQAKYCDAIQQIQNIATNADSPSIEEMAEMQFGAR